MLVFQTQFVVFGSVVFGSIVFDRGVFDSVEECLIV